MKYGNKLDGMEGVKRLLSGELVVKTTERSFAIWKTIVLGRNTSPGAYREALKDSGYHIGHFADQILNGVEVGKTVLQLDLVVKTVAELGFKDNARRDAIYARAIELGLELCPAEVGPALRLQYPDQPYKECLRIAMEPIAGLYGDLKVFGVDRNDDERWLNSDYGGPGSLWYADYLWVFVAPRK